MAVLDVALAEVDRDHGDADGDDLISLGLALFPEVSPLVCKILMGDLLC